MLNLFRRLWSEEQCQDIAENRLGRVVKVGIWVQRRPELLSRSGSYLNGGIPEVAAVSPADIAGGDCASALRCVTIVTGKFTLPRCHRISVDAISCGN